MSEIKNNKNVDPNFGREEGVEGEKIDQGFY